MGHNLLFTLRCFLPLFLGGMIALNSCKEERASINDDPGQGDDGGDEYEYVDDRYDNGISCEEYLTNYRGIPFKKDSEGNSLSVISGVSSVIEAEDFDDAVEQAVWLEHGNRHSAHIHSKNVDNITKYAKAIDTAILVKNGPSYAALGFGGEGYCTFTIASRTGEGLTSASTFTKRRRCVMTDSLCIR